MTNPKINGVMMTESQAWPKLGCGAGLRSQHYPEILKSRPAIGWFEAVTENFMDSGGRPLATLEQVRRHYPVALHGVSLSIGSTDPLDREYLKRLKALAERIDPPIISDHLCWATVDGKNLHDLLPLPFTEEAITHVVNRVHQVQEFLGRTILLENVSSYLTYRHSVMPEWEFLAEVARRSGCGILLDLNNIYVNSVNHQFDPYVYLENIPADKVGQFHLAGHTDMGTFLFDTHSKPVISPVWDLYREALNRFGPVASLIEWDEDLPSFDRLMKEVKKAEEIYSASLRGGRKADEATCLSETQIASGAAIPRNDGVSVPASDPSLRRVQQWMKSRILKEKSPDSFEDLLTPQNNVPGVERILVYAGGYTVRIGEALAETYETIANVLGHEKFHQMTEDYVAVFPSRYYNLTTAGKHLPEFLKTWKPAAEFPFLPDLAAFEWRVSRAFHAFDSVPFDRSGLAGLAMEDWENMSLILQPSAALFRSEWSVLEIWKLPPALRAVGPEGANQPVTVDIERYHKPQYALVSRQDLKVRTENLSAAQYRLLELLMSGRTLGEACEALADAGEDLPVAEWFTLWVQDGVIADCRLAGHSLAANSKS